MLSLIQTGASVVMGLALTILGQSDCAFVFILENLKVHDKGVSLLRQLNRLVIRSVSFVNWSLLWGATFNNRLSVDFVWRLK